MINAVGNLISDLPDFLVKMSICYLINGVTDSWTVPSRFHSWLLMSISCQPV
jgi:hypothetical protein